MTASISRRWMALAACAALLVMGRSALAGPPLICHPFETGATALLPWGTGKSWNAVDPAYDVANLPRDLDRVLQQQQTLLGRMENLRRAVVYSASHPAVARQVLIAAMTRAATGPRDHLAWFDAAYLIESYRQAKHARLGNMLSGIGRPATSFRELNELDGDAMLETLMAQQGATPDYAFAHALMAPDNATAHQRWQKSRTLAGSGTLLSRNVALMGY
jgi:hypothetical protein